MNHMKMMMTHLNLHIKEEKRGESTQELMIK
jgi:hypothetical protein